MNRNQPKRWPDLSKRRAELEAQLESAEGLETQDRHATQLELAEVEYLTGDLDTASGRWQKILDNSGVGNQKSAAHLGLAWVTYTQSNWNKCENLIRKGLNLNPKRETEASLLALRGLLSYRKGIYDEAIVDCKEALKLSPEGKVEGLAHSTLGIVAHARKKNQEALDHWERAQAQAQSLEASDLVVRVINNLGTYHYNNKDYKVAKELFTEAVTIGRQVHFQAFLGFPLINLAGVCFELNELDSGIEVLDEAEAIFDQLNDMMMLGAINIEKGRFYRLQRDFRRSLTHYDRALELSRDCGFLRHVMFAYRELGLLQRDQRHWSEAVEYLRLARELAIVLKDRVKEVEVDRYLKECIERSGRVL